MLAGFALVKAFQIEKPVIQVTNLRPVIGVIDVGGEQETLAGYKRPEAFPEVVITAAESRWTGMARIE